MFITAASGKTYPYEIEGARSNKGMWVVHVDSDEYRAWEYWLHHEIGKNFFAKPTMQGWYRWPPGTQAAADHVAQCISDIRDGEDQTAAVRKDKTRPAIGGARVPRHPTPWNGYIPDPPPPEKIISFDAMQEIRKRLQKNWIGKKDSGPRLHWIDP